jgi:hypothetical protein
MLISILIFIIVLGLIYYLVTLLPLPAPFKQIALIVVIIIAILWLIGGVGGPWLYPHCNRLIC